MTTKLVVPITFKIYQGGNLVRTETIAQNVIKIGRDAKSHLKLDDDSVARMHAVIEAKPEEVQVIDLGSGTTVNGQSVNKSSLKSGDRVKVGNTELEVEIGQPVDAAAAAPAPAPTAAPAAAPAAASFAAPNPFVAPNPFSAPAAAPAPAAHGGGHGGGHGPSVGGEEIYQLIKRSDINPSEVEDASNHASEVSVLWKSSILHVAHLSGKKDFVLSAEKGKHAPASQALMGGMGAGAATIAAGAATGNYAVGAVGSVLMLLGAGAGIFLDDENNNRSSDTSRFIVGPEMLGGAGSIPVVLNQGGGTRFVFPQGATGEVEIDGVRRPLQELISSGQVRPSGSAPGGHEIELRPGVRCKMELGGLTVMAKVVAQGRKVAGAGRRDTAMLGSFGGAFAGVAAGVLAMRFAVADDSGYLSNGNEEDRLNELRAFIQRQQERQPEQQQQQPQPEQQAEGGTGTAHAGESGKMGNRQAPARNARYEIRNNGQPPQLSRQQARDQIQNRGVFSALGAPGGGMAGGSSGIVSPFGGLTESGVGDRNANGNMTGAEVGDAFGYGGLGASGMGWGGGGTGEGTIGMGNVGTMGHGSGTGSGQGYGSGAGRGLAGRSNQGPIVRAAPPDVTGLLSPEAIRRVVLRNLGQVAHCHEQGLAQNPSLEGRVVVRFIIGGTGSVMGSAVADSNLAVPSVAQCIANAVRRWQFPSPEGGGIVTVNYPFNLQHPQ